MIDFAFADQLPQIMNRKTERLKWQLGSRRHPMQLGILPRALQTLLVERLRGLAILKGAVVRHADDLHGNDAGRVDAEKGNIRGGGESICPAP